MTSVVEPDAAPSTDPIARRRRRRRLLIGIPLGILVVLVAVTVWGLLQPRPDGFAPTDPDEGAEVTEEWTRYTIDASGATAYFDLDAGRMVAADEPGWDLSFHHTTILTNSGVSGDGDSGAMDLGEVELVDAVVPQDVVFATDIMGGEDGDEQINPELDGWYGYNYVTHVISVSDSTFLVRADDSFALVQFDSYYCEDESPRCITFRYRLVSDEA